VKSSTFTAPDTVLRSDALGLPDSPSLQQCPSLSSTYHWPAAVRGVAHLSSGGKATKAKLKDSPKASHSTELFLGDE